MLSHVEGMYGRRRAGTPTQGTRRAYTGVYTYPGYIGGIYREVHLPGDTLPERLKQA